MFKHLLLECEEGMSGASPIDATLHTTAPSVDNATGPSGKDFAELLGEGSSTRSGEAIVAHAYPESPSVGTGPQSGPMPTSSELAASIPRLKTPAPEIMERYTPKTLGSYESDVPGIGDQPGVRKYGTTIVLGDQAIRDGYHTLREEAVRSGKENQKVLATVENQSNKNVFVVPFRMEQKPNNRAKTTLDSEGRLIVQFGVDRAGFNHTGGRSSPSVIAMHELAHAAQWQHEVVLKAIPRGLFKDASEERIIIGAEADALRAIGQPPRDQYSGGFNYRTDGITQTKAADPKVEEVLTAYEEGLKEATSFVRHYIPDIRDMANAPKPATEPSPSGDIVSAAIALGYRNSVMRGAENEVATIEGRLPPS
jgi:hypothetical protein